MKKHRTRSPSLELLECPVCGRAFLRPVKVVYKILDKKYNCVPVCSYTCMRKVQKEQEAAKK